MRLIAPKRFNPTGEAWLPVFHAAGGHWRFSKAHELGRTKVWVVIYAHMIRACQQGASPKLPLKRRQDCRKRSQAGKLAQQERASH